MTRYQRIVRYFHESPLWSVVLIIFLILAAIGGLLNNWTSLMARFFPTLAHPLSVSSGILPGIHHDQPQVPPNYPSDAPGANRHSATTLTAAMERVTVLVVPFENISGVRALVPMDIDATNKSKSRQTVQIDRYSEAPKSIMEDIIFRLGGIPVERKQLDAILQEYNFGQSGLIDSDHALELGKLVGARLLVAGTIERINTEKRKFSGRLIPLAPAARNVVTAAV